jgi:hypothetical protein
LKEDLHDSNSKQFGGGQYKTKVERRGSLIYSFDGKMKNESWSKEGHGGSGS